MGGVEEQFTLKEEEMGGVGKQFTVKEEELGNEGDDEVPETEEHVLTIHNVLAAANMGDVKLDMDKVSQILGNSYWQPSEFPSVRVDVKLNGNAYTISIFETGKMQSTGGCRPEESKRSMMKISKKLRNNFPDLPIKFRDFQVQNILAVINLGHKISLSKLEKVYIDSDYEPQRFPALRARIPVDVPDQRKMKSKQVVTVNIFSTGNITFTGGKSPGSIEMALAVILPYIKDCAF
eukprot:GHVP01026983.1.p1 GENE.GHVP01026983.1~~GHVP01026983.1.p1  ORF type:complete len:254 (-),score=46.52 GHVP01026983.1:648-1352(-)